MARKMRALGGTSNFFGNGVELTSEVSTVLDDRNGGADMLPNMGGKLFPSLLMGREKIRLMWGDYGS